MSASFHRLATVKAEIQRPAKIVNGKRGNPETVYTDVDCTPLDPASDQEVARAGLPQASSQMMKTSIEGDYDIHTGDFLIAGGVTHPIKSVRAYAWQDTQHIRLIVERLHE
jgi:hypothetical protein